MDSTCVTDTCSQADYEDAGFGHLYKLESQLYLDESARNVPAGQLTNCFGPEAQQLKLQTRL